jgi:hypothetical protein
MKRTINSTGRRRLPQNLVTVRLNEPAGGLPRSFTAQFSGLAEAGLPADARIYGEPYVASSSARFTFGTVAAVTTPADTQLTELDEGAAVLFRVKVVDETGDVGKILASAEGIAPRGREDSDGRKPLLPIRHTDLGEELWQLQIDRDRGPELCVSNRVPGLADRVRSEPLVQGLVLPVVLRQIVSAIQDADDDAEWALDWKAFCGRLAGEEIDWEMDSEEDDQAIQDLIRRIARRFVEGQRYTSRARASLGVQADD